jgi:hypothetical protein
MRRTLYVQFGAGAHSRDALMVNPSLESAHRPSGCRKEALSSALHLPRACTRSMLTGSNRWKKWFVARSKYGQVGT